MNSIQIKHRTRNLGQWLKKITVGVIGGYHGGNLGDIALGESVLEVLHKRSVKSGLQTIYNLEKWPSTPYAIIGGGAIGYIDSLRKIVNRYNGDYSKIALLGVDFNEDQYPDDCKNLFQNSAYVSCRSQKQSNKIQQLVPGKEIFNHPDLTFSFRMNYCENIRNKPKEHSIKKLLINVVPLYSEISNGQIKPQMRFKNERPELFENFETMHACYKKVIQTAVNKAILDGYVVESLPFAQEDELFSKIILEGLPVKLNKFVSNPDSILKFMAKADWIISTRFHATIFAMKLGLKFTPIAYAVKNELLLLEGGIDRTQFLTTGDMANGVSTLPPPIKVDSKLIKQWAERSHNAISNSINSLKLV